MYEIERKFLIKKDKLPDTWDKELDIIQTYICDDKNKSIRIKFDGYDYILTIKLSTDKNGKIEKIEKNLTKEEFENILKTTSKKIVKKRKLLYNDDGTVWEVDFFENLKEPYKDLIIAEIELEDINQEIVLPDWIDKEVTNDKRYLNSNLVNFSI